MLDKYMVSAESSLDESAEFNNSHKSNSLNDDASREIMRSTLHCENSIEQSKKGKVRLVKPDIQILDQNN